MQQAITIVIQHLLHVQLLHVWCGMRLRSEHLADLATGQGRQMRTGRLAKLF